MVKRPVDEISRGRFVVDREVTRDAGGAVRGDEALQILEQPIGRGRPFGSGHDAAALADFRAQRLLTRL